MTGRVDFFFSALSSALPYIREGKLMALAVSTPKPTAALPDVPTTIEAGFPDSDTTFWIAVFAPAKTPGPIVQKLHDVTRRTLAEPAMRERLAELGVDAMDMEPAELDALVRKEIAVNAAVVKAAHIQVK